MGKVGSWPVVPEFRAKHRVRAGATCLNFPKLFSNITRIYTWSLYSVVVNYRVYVLIVYFTYCIYIYTHLYTIESPNANPNHHLVYVSMQIHDVSATQGHNDIYRMICVVALYCNLVGGGVYIWKFIILQKQFGSCQNNFNFKIIWKWLQFNRNEFSFLK